MKIKFQLLFCLILLLTLTCGMPPRASLILHNGRIATVDKDFSFQEAIAISGNRIIYVGSNDVIIRYIGPQSKMIDLKGALATPGMVDAHCHPFNLGNDDESDYFSVGRTKSWQGVIRKIAAKVKTLKPGEWIVGGGWYQDDWNDNSIPVHDGLSAVSPENPVFLYRRGGNSAFVNQKALDIAGITRDTPDPYGGKIRRKSNGEPSGFLVNMGNNLVKKYFPKPPASHGVVY